MNKQQIELTEDEQNELFYEDVLNRSTILSKEDIDKMYKAIQQKLKRNLNYINKKR